MGRKKLTLEEIERRKIEKEQNRIKKEQNRIYQKESVKKLEKDKNSPFYSMTLHDNDYIYLQTRWERYLKYRDIINKINNSPLEGRDWSAYNHACSIVVDSKNLIIDFLTRYGTYQNVLFVKQKIREIEK